MSRMNELAAVLDEMVECGQKLISTAEAIRAVFTDTAETTPSPEPPAEKTYTLADVMDACKEKAKAGHTTKVRSLLDKFGAEKVSGLKAEDYPSFMKELEAVG